MSMIATSGADAGIRVERLGRGTGLADDLEIVFDLEQLAYTAAHDLVIVEQEDCESS